MMEWTEGNGNREDGTKYPLQKLPNVAFIFPFHTYLYRLYNPFPFCLIDWLPPSLFLALFFISMFYAIWGFRVNNLCKVSES